MAVEKRWTKSLYAYVYVFVSFPVCSSGIYLTFTHVQSLEQLLVEHVQPHKTDCFNLQIHTCTACLGMMHQVRFSFHEA